MSRPHPFCKTAQGLIDKWEFSGCVLISVFWLVLHQMEPKCSHLLEETDLFSYRWRDILFTLGTALEWHPQVRRFQLKSLVHVWKSVLWRQTVRTFQLFDLHIWIREPTSTSVHDCCRFERLTFRICWVVEDVFTAKITMLLVWVWPYQTQNSKSLRKWMFLNLIFISKFFKACWHSDIVAKWQ